VAGARSPSALSVFATWAACVDIAALGIPVVPRCTGDREIVASHLNPDACRCNVRGCLAACDRWGASRCVASFFPWNTEQNARRTGQIPLMFVTMTCSTGVSVWIC
jgi:hypothetical protein